jgi:DNA-binding NarL/FixJ family response regulator
VAGLIGILGAMTITVFLADDHRLLRESLRELLKLEQDISIVGEASDGRCAITGILDTSPDIVLMDVLMPELNGIDAITNILLERPQTRIIMLSGRSDVEVVHRALQRGAQGYLSKASSSLELLEAIRMVDNGKRYISQDIPQSILVDFVQGSDSPLEKLSLRESEIFQLVVEGDSTATIAQKLGLSPKTVDTYRSRLMNKLGVKDIPSLVRMGIKYGLTPP